VSQALYRRYRPETFAEVIGQEHVTEPLMQALRANRITHAYLFSGPRGCGKTTSARILARCLNCEQGPTPEPCGTCPSCLELGRGGPGSLDVVEIDAASHNGVDDARDLRERAAFAPARDRYKVFILDEAHMVTSQGFNALLKIVEEPPPHVKFIFATTEPDKVIGTIRSRTHHYPFRLVAPDTLTPYLEQLCAAEGVAVGPGVLPLVVRSGGGSVRDSLSVLDQLVAGADAGGIDYEAAVALLGYTHAALLDDAVGAISTHDGASAFRVVDRVISSGHEPRRFVEDLLERLRDLIVIAASGDSAAAVLRDLPSDQLERMRAQAASLGAGELSRSADLVNAALTEMTGATSPRLHLELLIARLLLPAVDDGGLVARVERVERAVEGGVMVGGGAGAVRPASASAAPAASAGAVVPPPAVPIRVPAPAPAAPVTPAAAAEAAPARPERSARPGVARPAAAEPTPEPAPVAEPTPVAAPAPVAEPSRPAERSVERPAATTPEPVPVAPEPVTPAAAAAPAEPVVPATHQAAAHTPPAEGEMIRARWAEVLETLRTQSRVAWTLVKDNAQVAGMSDGIVRLAFTTPQLATTFRSGSHPEHVRRALHETLGVDARVETVLAPAGGGAETGAAQTGTGAQAGATMREQAEASWGVEPAAVRPGARPTSSAPTGGAAPARPDRPASAGRGGEAQRPAGAPSASDRPAPAARPEATAPEPASTPVRPAPAEPSLASDGIPDAPEPFDGPEPPEPDRRAGGPSRPAPARGAGSPRPAAAPRPAPQRPSAPQRPAPAQRPSVDDGEDASPDDPEIAGSGLVGAPLIARMLGGTVIDEIPEEPGR
jgi:DNA polymerase-3 subunit gamma/tau